MYASTWDKVLLLKLKFGMTPKWHTLKNMKPTVIVVGFIAYAGEGNPIACSMTEVNEIKRHYETMLSVYTLK